MKTPDKYAAVCSKILTTLTFETKAQALAQVSEWEREFQQSKRDCEEGPYCYEIASWAVPTGPRSADRAAAPFETVELAEEYVALSNEEDGQHSSDAIKWEAMTPARYADYLALQ